ncbi:LuxR family transcriptional regulator [Paraburkholderia phytofirmans OLGA172]|uniref:LuxR family transcriptional regulator n=1 Tax=Paraburkholderia phytofirmans OLGA172 TaxID=1417228 RepID=A0A160FIP8_9BURK|nr:response regulator transcription factor [Paraburkholderia phytofirmans]ANB72159.1 LuxR family transcriptional regulator [Paraburkholderia phytofirmans OLGA172]
MIRILVADDHAIVRHGVKQVVADTSDITVAAEATNGNEVVEKLRGNDIDLVLLDLAMPGISSLDLVRRVRTEAPTVPIIIFSMHDERQVVSRALRAGAAGYITKDSDPDLITDAIRKVASGGRFMDPRLVNSMIFNSSPDEVLPDILSDREYRVLELLAVGKTVNEIAEDLHLSAKTVSTHKVNLMHKLSIGNIADLIRYALAHGVSPR